MKVKICNLLRVTTYLELLVASLIIASFGYKAYLQIDIGLGIVSFLVMSGAVLQVTYSIAVIRLMHHYAPGHKIPDNSFLRFYNTLLKLNVAAVVGLSVLFLVQFLGLIRLMAQPVLPDPQQLLQVCIIGSYTVVCVYTMAGAARLKKAILQRQDWLVENWLEEMGQHYPTSNYSAF